MCVSYRRGEGHVKVDKNNCLEIILNVKSCKPSLNAFPRGTGGWIKEKTDEVVKAKDLTKLKFSSKTKVMN